MIRITKDSVDLLTSAIKSVAYLERELGLRNDLGSANPVQKVEDPRKLAEVAAATGRSTERTNACRRVRYDGVDFICFREDDWHRQARRLPWQ